MGKNIVRINQQDLNKIVCKSKTVNANDIRAFVNMPCPRISSWSKAHKSLVYG